LDQKFRSQVFRELIHRKYLIFLIIFFIFLRSEAQDSPLAAAESDQYAIGISFLSGRSQMTRQNPDVGILPTTDLGVRVSSKYFISCFRNGGAELGIRFAYTRQGWKTFSNAGILADRLNGIRSSPFGSGHWEFPFSLQLRQPVGKKHLFYLQSGFSMHIFMHFWYSSSSVDSLDNLVFLLYYDWRTDKSLHSFLTFETGIMLGIKSGNFFRLGLAIEYNFLNSEIYSGEYFFYESGNEFTRGKYYSNGDHISLSVDYVIGRYRRRAESSNEFF